MRPSFLHLCSPSRLEFRNMILSEESLTFCLVCGQRFQIGANFTAKRSLNVHLLGIVEKSKKLIEVTLLDGIELMIVALCAADGEAEKYRAEGCGTVYHFLVTELLHIDSVFSVCHGIPLEASRHFLFHG